MFTSLSIRSRLLLGFAALCALVVAVSATGLWFLHQESAAFRRYVQEFDTRQHLAGEILDQSYARAVAARNLVLVTDEHERAAERARAVAAHTAVNAAHERLAALIATTPGVTPAERERYARMKEVESRYGPVALGIVELVTVGQRDAAVQRMNAVYRPLLADLVKAATDYADWAKDASRREIETLEADLQRSVLLLSGAAAVGVVAAIALAIMMTRRIVTPIQDALRVARTVAAGDLSAEIRVSSRDEAGQLLDALRDMTGRLSAIVAGVRQGRENISHGSAEIAASSAGGRRRATTSRTW